MEKYIVVKDSMKKTRKFGVQGRTLEFKIKPIPANMEPVRWVEDAIRDIVLKGTEGVEPEDKVGFTFCSKDFAKGDGWIAFKPAREVTVDNIWEKICSIYQSNSAGLNTETFCLGITTVKMPQGKGRGRNYNNYDEECAKRRGIVVIKNKDNLCLPRALVVAKAHVDKDPLYSKIRGDTGKLQYSRAMELVEQAGVTISSEGCGIPALQQFQQHLKNHKIIVYRYGSKGRDVIFEGNGNGPSLNLLYHNDHYNVINSLTAAFCCTYFCESCHTPYNNKNQHSCAGTCFACRKSPPCAKDVVKQHCGDCGRDFYGNECFKAHLKSVCNKIKRCKECFKIYTKKHVCGEIYCKICKSNQSEDHFCYMQPNTAIPPTKDFLFVFYDLETTQEKVQPDGSVLQEPNLCVFQQCCDLCIKSDIKICNKCGVRLQVLQCDDPISPFVHHVLTLRKKFRNVVVLAHNGGGFDHQFVLNYILTKSDLKPSLIMRGTKLVLMEVGNVKFVDSLNYFPMPLSSLPKAFGLKELKKGYFPHLFNRSENQNYIGPIPALEYYDADNLKGEARKNLLKWYSEKVEENYIFDFQKEIVEYCISDVEILTKACLKFRQQLIDTSNVCPFFEACTVASTCNKVFRRNFLEPNTIGIIPKGGYRFKDNQSKIALQWLIWEEYQRGIEIQHAARGKEAIVAGVKVDGLCNNQVFEFQGCYYHGCPACFKYNRDKPLDDDASDCMENRYDRTRNKIRHLQSKGYEVVEMWECEFRKTLNNEIQIYTENHPSLKHLPLNPRDALYGGRTGNTVEFYKKKENEKIKYADVCSLYPWVCKYGKFPIGHPKKIYVGKNECDTVDVSQMSGVIKCKILPPTNLYHPVLPTKMNNKCMFVLCRKCGEEFINGQCNHSDEEKALEGTWVMEEVAKALEKGYKMMEIYEIWEYETVQLSKEQEGLFSEMMNKFIKIKQQASGWPKGCVTDEEKNRYIEEFLRREGVLLEFSEITENPGLRSLAKLMLNSFWGKFAQRENLPKTSIVRTTEEFFLLMSNPGIFVNTIVPVNEETLIVTWEHKEEAYNLSPTVNVVLAAYVTALARLKLYSYLEQMEDRVLYYDTDSVIYISRSGFPDLPTGDCIGDLTDELSGGYITEFVSGGPKNYAYKYTVNGGEEESVVCKVKGISLNYKTSQTIHFDSIKKAVLEKHDYPLIVPTKQILRTKEHEVVTVTSRKIYKPNSVKRIFFDDGSSEPYGFKKQRN